uniref:Putative secreted protein n=1 Tax=Anopheles triannulatus TaxID=58253 RepID=A0A2M4B702_9DIPT
MKWILRPGAWVTIGSALEGSGACVASWWWWYCIPGDAFVEGYQRVMDRNLLICSLDHLCQNHLIALSSSLNWIHFCLLNDIPQYPV